MRKPEDCGLILYFCEKLKKDPETWKQNKYVS